MQLSNNERIGQSLTLLSQALSPYVEQKMREVYGNSWFSQVNLCLSNKNNFNRSNEEIFQDVSTLLTIINQRWDKVFKKYLSSERYLISELIEVRNRWAHINGFSPEDAFRALDSIHRLLVKIGAEQEKTVDAHKQIVFKLLSQKQSNFSQAQMSQADEQIREQLKELLDIIPFQDARLLLRALTHRSYMFENPTKTQGDNEQLEFLGDSVLQFLAGDYVYEKYFGEQEGQLTQKREKIVSNEALAILAQNFNLGKWIKLGRGEELTGGRTNPTLLSNTLEAVIGAYYKDSGIDAVWEWLKPMLEQLETIKIEANCSQVLNDAKNTFQHWAITNHKQNPEYIVIQESGNAHNRVFTVAVKVNGISYGQGTATRIRDAEKQAATLALNKLT
ncbi:ribonuclease III [Planktothrix paucivesiculata]|uniref:Ribonuclease 3 n=1 Tax=Planktothrix paucivesiculata PCC 9631 TaxID=671071 RepID=A0A7Z9BP54_9CYAN|nr:ribonuclease III [Planktothrix paucivesiculata]VXD18882.1 Ribonuclease 3 [Planktothrix paucivesiculata PCC 9631]